MQPTRNIDTTEGGGPWTVPDAGIPELAPGEQIRVDMRRLEYRGEKRYFQPWLPLDNAVVKNLDLSNRLEVEYNGQFDAIVEPSAVDSFSQAGVVSVIIRNAGTGTIAPGDVVLQVSKDAYDADQQARDRRKMHPVEKIARNFVGL